MNTKIYTVILFCALVFSCVFNVYSQTIEELLNHTTAAIGNNDFNLLLTAKKI